MGIGGALDEESLQKGHTEPLRQLPVALTGHPFRGDARRLVLPAELREWPGHAGHDFAVARVVAVDQVEGSLIQRKRDLGVAQAVGPGGADQQVEPGLVAGSRRPGQMPADRPRRRAGLRQDGAGPAVERGQDRWRHLLVKARSHHFMPELEMGLVVSQQPGMQGLLHRIDQVGQ